MITTFRVTQDYATAAEANEVRMALYNLRRTVRSFKYFRPDIDDKIARFKASVQGTTLYTSSPSGEGNRRPPQASQPSES